MMSSNSAGSVNRPAARTLIWYVWPGPGGGAPTWPAATCTFCSRSACTTSSAVMLRPASRSGSSHSRIAYRRSPKTNDVADAGHALQLVLDEPIDVVADEREVVFAVLGERARGEHEVVRDLRDRDADRVDLARQPPGDLRDPVLDVDGRDVQIARDVERDRDRRSVPSLPLDEVMYCMPSMPLIACSSGVVTAVSTVCALAPL